ncbi:MAG: hypothetical protein H7Y31_17255 [Chitinophagaceae bacterium]|nr:hypothetical protein [Chitinophagaceae bacterium]
MVIINDRHVSVRLHEDILEEVYGKIAIHVMYDDDKIREVVMIDEEDIVRTYALSLKRKSWRFHPEIEQVNKQIRNGAAIGQAFRSAGFAIERRLIDAYQVTTPLWLQAAFMNDTPVARARTIEVSVEKYGKPYSYAIITEIYTPHFFRVEGPESKIIHIEPNSKNLALVARAKTAMYLQQHLPGRVLC